MIALILGQFLPADVSLWLISRYTMEPVIDNSARRDGSGRWITIMTKNSNLTEY
jgi:hypothetical protein